MTYTPLSRRRSSTQSPAHTDRDLPHSTAGAFQPFPQRQIRLPFPSSAQSQRASFPRHVSEICRHRFLLLCPARTISPCRSRPLQRASSPSDPPYAQREPRRDIHSDKSRKSGKNPDPRTSLRRSIYTPVLPVCFLRLSDKAKDQIRKG